MTAPDNQAPLPTLSVGIPAYNEEQNIKHFLTAVLAQERRNFILKEVIVLSDQSTDRTVEEALSVHDPLVSVETAATRGGKSARFRDIAKKFTGDLLVQFDADTALGDTHVLENLVAVWQAEGADLVSANVRALKPKTYWERIAYFGAQVWWENLLTMLGSHALVYRCQGRGRLFTRSFLKDFYLPDDAAAAEDIFSFFWSMQNKKKVAFAPLAIVYYRLPSNWKDYKRQATRFIKTYNILHAYFPDELLREWFMHNTPKIRILAMLKSSLQYNPIITGCYVLVQKYLHYAANNVANTTKFWADVPSTKKVK